MGIMEKLALIFSKHYTDQGGYHPDKYEVYSYRPYQTKAGLWKWKRYIRQAVGFGEPGGVRVSRRNTGGCPGKGCTTSR